MHYIKFNKWWSTKHFSQAGQAWVKDGSYCPFPEGTPAYYEYWDEQDDYINNGFVHEGQRIAGLHYLYLNFCPIKDKKKKTVTIPDFWVQDAEHFYEVEKVMGLGPVVDPFRPAIFVESKSRQVGASLKGCVPVLYNMCFVPFSQNYIGAWFKNDAEKTCQMFLNYFYHNQRHSEFGKRFVKKSDLEEYMTGYIETIDGDRVPAGFQSELKILSFKDNTTKGVGGACDLAVIEESGLHPELIESLKYIEPACKDGDYTTGAIIAYGAAGREAQCKDLEKVHTNPGGYRVMAYDNIWEPDSPHKKTAYFIPNYACRKGHIDEDGNPNCESAIIARDESLAILEKSDYETYLLELSQFPNTPSEMFSSRGRKRFQTKIINQQIAFLEGNGITGTAIELYEDINTKQIRFDLADEKYVRPIREYPLKPGTDKAGCVEIFEFPSADPPPGLYIGAIDSYNHEDAYYSNSLGSIFIYKTANSLAGEGTNRVIVAEYTGRPKTKNDFYKICAYLIRMYNAVVMPENEDQEMVPWFINNGYEDLLADQPDIIFGYIPNSKVKRQKGIHGDIHLIVPAENKIDRYINEDLGTIYDGDGNVLSHKMGVSRILSLGALYELKAYVHDQFKNFDRVRTLGWTFMMEEEKYLNVVKQPTDKIKDFLVNTKRFNQKRKTVRA
jgi:hypothetical protein